MGNCQHKVFETINSRTIMRECKRRATEVFSHEMGTTNLCRQHFDCQFAQVEKAIEGYKKLAEIVSECPVHVPGVKVSIPSVNFLLGEARRLEKRLERFKAGD